MVPLLLLAGLLVALATGLILWPAADPRSEAAPWGTGSPDGAWEGRWRDPWPAWQAVARPAPPPGFLGRVRDRLAGHLAQTRLARDLAVSGLPHTLGQVAARKLRLPPVLLGAALGLWLWDVPTGALVLAAAAVWSFQGPDMEIARRAGRRRATIQRELPSFLFTLAVLTEAGMQLLPAVEHYSRQSRDSLAAELRSALSEVRLGQTPALAFLNLAQHLEVRDFTLFVGALVQTLEKGSDGLTATLRLQAEAAWDQRRRRAQELGHKASVKLFIPLILFVLPSILAIAVGPAVFGFVTQFLR